MDESQQQGKSEQEKNSLTPTNLNQDSDNKKRMQVVPFTGTGKKERGKQDVLALMGAALEDIESGEVSSLTHGVVILVCDDGDDDNSEVLSMYSTKMNSLQMVGILEMMKQQVIENT